MQFSERRKKVKSKQIHLFTAAPVSPTLNWNLVMVFQHMKLEQKYQQNVFHVYLGGRGCLPGQNKIMSYDFISVFKIYVSSALDLC